MISQTLDLNRLYCFEIWKRGALTSVRYRNINNSGHYFARNKYWHRLNYAKKGQILRVQIYFLYKHSVLTNISRFAACTRSTPPAPPLRVIRPHCNRFRLHYRRCLRETGDLQAHRPATRQRHWLSHSASRSSLEPSQVRVREMNTFINSLWPIKVIWW